MALWRIISKLSTWYTTVSMESMANKGTSSGVYFKSSHLTALCTVWQMDNGWW